MPIDQRITFCICDFESTGLSDQDYPIEVGCIFTDHNLVIQDIYSDLILYPQLEKELREWQSDVNVLRNPSLQPWPSRYKVAGKIHKISSDKLLDDGVEPLTAAMNIKELALRFQVADKKPVILSDNAQFEYRLMQHLFKQAGVEFPFHYSAWDSSLLLELTGVGDPKNVPHRAFPDAALLHQALVRAWDRVQPRDLTT